MNSNKKQSKHKLFSCVVMCSLLFSACAQKVEPQQDHVVTLSEIAGEAKETEEINTTAEAAMSDLSKAKNADEALALLIADEGFREKVRYGIGIVEEDSPEEVLQKLENCESIELSGDAIYSLQSLSLLPNLKRLEIIIKKWNDSTITDFTPIAQLSQLEELSVTYAKDDKVDLSFLGQMRTVTELTLKSCKIADFSFLGEMSQLQCLSLYETPVDDLAVLEKLPELVELSLYGNENAKNIEAVGTLTKMQDLELQYCGIEDISFLSGLTELRRVDLNGNSIMDIAPLADLDKLEWLGLSENRISDISVIGNMSNLFDLLLDGNEIQDISALAGLSHLNQVSLSDNQIEDLSPLAGKEELMYAAVSRNPITNIEPLFEVPLLTYWYKGASEEEKAFVADWLAEYYPEAEEHKCVDFIQGDLNNDGCQDIAFVVDSDAFQQGSVFFEDRQLFILLQQKDGSWVEVEDTPGISSGKSGGMKGDPYYGMFMQAGYLWIKEGRGSSYADLETRIYEYRNGLNLKKTISAGYYSFADGFDVRIRNEQDGTWLMYVIAMDGYRMVRVDLADSEHVWHKAFPIISLSNGYHIYEDKKVSQLTASEALDLVLEAAVEDTASAVQEKLPYTDWQKDGYELLLGVTLPDYYYVMPEAKREADDEPAEWEGDYLYYDGLIEEDGTLYHVIRLIQEEEKGEFLLDDATGEIKE